MAAGFGLIGNCGIHSINLIGRLVFQNNSNDIIFAYSAVLEGNKSFFLSETYLSTYTVKGIFQLRMCLNEVSNNVLCV